MTVMKENEMAIDVSGIDMSFGSLDAVRGLGLQVKRGSAMALLGENGAGKTTTLRVLAGLYQAAAGQGTVLGHPLGADTPAFFQRLGYVSENQKLPMHWTVGRLVDYLKPQYPTWDDGFCVELIDNFELPRDRKIGQMSRGMQMKVALVASLAYRPELLLLDEPFSGLDPLVREEFIDGILELMGGGEWTLLLSSHDIHEVERLCDEVTLIDQGKVVLSEPLDELQSRFRQWSIHARGGCKRSDFPDDWMLVEQLGEHSWSLVETRHDPARSEHTMFEFFGPLAGAESKSLSLRDIYLVLAREKKRRRRSARVAATS